VREGTLYDSAIGETASGFTWYGAASFWGTSVKRIVVVIVGCVLAASCKTQGPSPSTGSPPQASESAPSAPSTPFPSPVGKTPRPAPPVPATPEAKAKAQSLTRQASESLDRGDEEGAKGLLATALALDSENKSAVCLVRGIRADPFATLGRTSTLYTVRAGETLSTIAKRALGDACEFYLLARYNQIRVPRQLAAGQVIRIPGNAPLASPEPPSALARPPRPVTPPEPPAEASPPPPSPAPAPLATPAPDNTAIAQEVERHHRAASEAFSRQDLDTAIKEWDRVLELDPGNELARVRREQAIALQKKINQISR